MTNHSELKTIGLTPALHCADQALFHVARDVPLGDALSMASDFLHLAKLLSEDAAYARDTDRHAWAAHYLMGMGMGKALVDDAVKVLERDRVVGPMGKRAAEAGG